MKRSCILSALLFLLGVTLFSSAQNSSALSDSEKARIERLAGLAKVWGTVKFFHPYLAYREIDWDQALVETIPKVNAAKTPEEYNAAVNHLLSFLHDPNSYAEITPTQESRAQPTGSAPKNEAKDLVRLQDGVLIVEAVKLAEVVMREGTYEKVDPSLAFLKQSLTPAKAIVWDCRTNDEVNKQSYFFVVFDAFLRRTLSDLLDASATFGTSRYRVHNGYAPQEGFSSGGYYSGLSTTIPTSLIGQGKTKPLPMVFLTNIKVGDLSQVFAGLQAMPQVLIVQEGMTTKEPGISSYKIGLPEGVSVNMRVTELVAPDGSIGFEPDAIVAKSDQEDAALKVAYRRIRENAFIRRKRTANAITALRGEKDNVYAEMEFPTTEYRLLGLFRFWNVINYFYPHKKLIDRPWDGILPRYISKFEANKDAADYQLTAREMVAELQDSHGVVNSPSKKGAERLGLFYPAFTVKYLEKQTVVTDVFDEKTNVKIGDSVLSIDDEPIEKRRERFAIYVAASTSQALNQSIHRGFLRGAENSRMKMTVRGANGETRVVEIARTLSGDQIRMKANSRERALPVFSVLPSGYGYVDMTQLQFGEVNKMFEGIMKAPATIFDMRGYPNGTIWAIAPRLTEKEMPVAALLSRPIWAATDLVNLNLPLGASYTFAQPIPPNYSKGEIYKGKVVVLINEDAISQAEHSCLFFEVATDVTFIGTPTAGANGDVTLMFLPGNISVSFTGHDVRHADGRQLQKVGIQPHIRVEPTIRGLVEKRDEILDAAIKFLQEGGKK